MELNDVSTTWHAAVDLGDGRAAARFPPGDDATEPSGSAAQEQAERSVPVLRGVRPARCPWVQVTELTMADGARVVVGLVGEIDIANAGYLRAELTYLLESGHRDIVADLTKTVSISSSGLGVLVGAHKAVRRLGGRLQLVAAADSLLKVLRITRLTQVFTVHRTLDDALGR